MKALAVIAALLVAGAAEAQSFTVLAGSTVTASGSKYVTGLSSGEVDLLVNVSGSVSGTTPQLTVTVAPVDPLATSTVLNTSAVSTPVLSAAGAATPVVLAPFASSAALVSWVVSGAAASFGGVNVTLVNRTAVAVSKATNTIPSYSQALAFTNNTAGYALAVGDFNRDGNPDLVVPEFNANKLAIYLGTPSGVFNATPTSTLTTGNGPRMCVVKDFNTDGLLDLACTNKTDGTVSVFLGHGDGTFGTGSTFTGLANNQAIAAGVLGSGAGQAISLVVFNRSTTGAAILYGNGAGSFGAPVAFTGPNAVYQAVLNDLNGDGILDLICGGQVDNTMDVFLGATDAGFLPVQSFGSSTGPQGFAVGDVNNDGLPDVVDTYGLGIEVWLGSRNKPSGAVFQWTTDPPQNVYRASLSSNTTVQGLALVDVNGDGSLDAVVTVWDLGTQTDGVIIFTNNGLGVFTPQNMIPFPALALPVGSPYEPLYPIVADFNHDNRPDIAVGNFVGAADAGVATAFPTWFEFLSTQIPQVTIAPGAVMSVIPQVSPGPEIQTTVNCVSNYATFLGGPSQLGKQSAIAVQPQFDSSPIWVGGPAVVTCPGCPFSSSDAGFTDAGPGVVGEELLPGGYLSKQMSNLGNYQTGGGLYCIKASGAEDGTRDGGWTVTTVLP